jgi:hypothetical protein
VEKVKGIVIHESRGTFTTITAFINFPWGPESLDVLANSIRDNPKLKEMYTPKDGHLLETR